jgi:hypothetical protein
VGALVPRVRVRAHMRDERVNGRRRAREERWDIGRAEDASGHQHTVAVGRHPWLLLLLPGNHCWLPAFVTQGD